MESFNDASGRAPSHLSPLYVSLNFTSAYFVWPELFSTVALILTRLPSIVPACSDIGPQSFQLGYFISSKATSVSRSGAPHLSRFHVIVSVTSRYVFE